MASAAVILLLLTPTVTRPAVPERGLTTYDVSAWIPVEPFHPPLPTPTIITAPQIVFRAYPALTARASVTPVISASPRFSEMPVLRVLRTTQGITARSLVFSAGRGVDRASMVYNELEDLILSGALPPEIAVLEAIG